MEFGAGRGEVEAICNVVVHCRDVSAASLGSTVAARRLVWKVRRISKRGRCQKLDVLGVAGRKQDSKPPTGECATSAGGPSEEVANVDAKQEHDMSRRSQ